jgi:hypothetical protein
MTAAGDASNQRTADHLRTIHGVGDMPRWTADALETAGDKGVADVADLLEKVHQNNPAQARQLADETFERLSPETKKRLRGMEAAPQLIETETKFSTKHLTAKKAKTSKPSGDGGLAAEAGRKATSDDQSSSLKTAARLRGTTFFGGAGMDGAYIQDMVKALEESGVKGVRAADPNKWSKGMALDAVDVFGERNRDDDESDFSSMGKEGDQFNLVGYSYGGLQAAQGAIDHADNGGKVDNLVLIGTPVSAEFLEKLKKHPNISKVEIIDLGEHGDPIRAGMSTGELVKGLPKLGTDFYADYDGTNRGHFYYSGDSEESRLRRRSLAKRLRELGIK